MKGFTDTRDAATVDELWLLQHPPVFTLGQAGSPSHILDAGDIEVLRTDRGGQVTYHGPGQLVGYLLMDVQRQRLGVKQMVCNVEQALVQVLETSGIRARANPEAHGVYVSDRKIAALGLRVRKGCTYHGFSLNVDMDLEPFTRINPCGYAGLAVTDMAREGVKMEIHQVEDLVIKQLCRVFGYHGSECSEKFVG